MQSTQKPCDRAEIIVKEYLEGESVNAFELGYFIYFFRSAYVACVALTEDKEVDLATLDDVKRSDIISKINKNVSTLWMEDLDPDIDLEFIEISKSSPLKFVAKTAGNCLAALTLAVVLSGGKANVYTGEFELPPIAEGIRALKEAFEQPQPHSLPSEKKAAIKNQNLGPNENG